MIAIVGVCWAMIAPPWQSPDVFTHFSYAESLATRLTLPGRPGHGEASSDAAASDALIGAHAVAFSAPQAKPSWNPADAARYRAQARHLSRSDGAGYTESDINPPLYYVYAAIGYTLAVGGDDLDRLNVIQLWGVLLLLGTTTGAWLLAGEIFGRRRLLQLLAAAVAGLQPMTDFITTSVNPDALLITASTLALWLGARVIKRGAPPRDMLALALLTAVAILSKVAGYELVPPVAFAMIAGWRLAPASQRRAIFPTFGPPLLIGTLPVLAWIQNLHSRGIAATSVAPPGSSALHGSTITGFFNYLWQFYLPRLPWQAPFHVSQLPLLPWPRVLPGLPAWNLWIREGWGVFGWIDVYMPSWIYVVLAIATIAVAIAVLRIVLRFRDRLRLTLTAFFAIALLSLLAVVHWAEWQTIEGGLGPNTQGRYACPLVAVFGLGVALIVSRLPARARGPSSAVLLVALLALQFVALATVAKAYYT